MKKVGIYLGSEPGRGGLFQYSLAVLEALSALPSERYSVLAAFFNPAWAPYVEATGIASQRLGKLSRERFTLGKAWCAACLPADVWRSAFWRMDPAARAFVRAGRDVWLFPAQDHWSFLAPVPAVVTIHDLMHRYEPRFSEVSRWGRYFFREYRFRNICRFASAVLVDSELGRVQVNESYGLGWGRLFSLPYIPPRYILDRIERPDFNVRYRLPNRFLFYPAQFWPHKNHARLLEAVAIARRSLPDITVVLAGPKSHEYCRLQRRASATDLCGHVIFTGYIPDADLGEFYRRATALVMPTFFGPTNLPPLEAFACGCPVAVSNVYAIPEQVGEAALLFDPSSTEEIAGVVKKLWSDDELRRCLIKKGYEKSARWGKEQFASSLRDILDRIRCGP